MKAGPRSPLAIGDSGDLTDEKRKKRSASICEPSLRVEGLDARVLPSNGLPAHSPLQVKPLAYPAVASQLAGDAVLHAFQEGDVHRPDGFGRERQLGRDWLSELHRALRST